MSWTDGRYRAFIVGVLRNGMRRYPPKFLSLREAEAGRKKTSDTGRLAMHYKCNECSKDFPKRLVQVDHIEPVVSSSGFTNWDEYIKRMFCSQDNLQVLCLDCHKRKTQNERKAK